MGKRLKAKPKTKKSTRVKNAKGGANTKSKTIEDRYKKLNQHEHVLKRSQMYIGSIKKETIGMWIFNENAKGNEPQIIFKEITYVPGLLK